MSKASFNLFRGELIGANMQSALKALSIAEKAHDGTLRKDGVTPYIEHPMKIASMLYDLGIRDSDLLACAILHDTIEDTKIKKADLVLAFGDKIATTVELLSKPEKYDNRIYYDGISNNSWATIIKLADRVHNLSTLNNFTEEKKAKYIKETLEYVVPLIKFAQHTYYEYVSLIRIFDLWIESIVVNLSPYLNITEGVN